LKYQKVQGASRRTIVGALYHIQTKKSIRQWAMTTKNKAPHIRFEGFSGEIE